MVECSCGVSGEDSLVRNLCRLDTSGGDVGFICVPSVTMALYVSFSPDMDIETGTDSESVLWVIHLMVQGLSSCS